MKNSPAYAILALLLATSACFDTAPTGLDMDVSVPSYSSVASDAVTVCHSVGSGEFLRLSIPVPALSGHLKHGDGEPGDLVPGREGYLFDETCAAVQAGYSISGLIRFAGVPQDGLTVDLVDGQPDAEAFATTVSTDGGAYLLQFVPPGEYWLRANNPDGRNWIAQTVTVVDEDLLQDIWLPGLIELASPANGAILSTATPTLEWVAFEGAARYLVQINESATWALHAFEESATNAYVVADLMPNVEYTWQVGALNADGWSIGTTTAAFTMTYQVPD